jgi:hypothetical protein
MSVLRNSHTPLFNPNNGFSVWELLLGLCFLEEDFVLGRRHLSDGPRVGAQIYIVAQLRQRDQEPKLLGSKFIKRTSRDSADSHPKTEP